MADALRLHVVPELDEPAMVLAFEGWNDAGEAATSAVSFVNEAISAVPLADIDPEEYYDFTVRRPLVSLDDEKRRHIEWPSNEFRYGSLDSTREILTGIGVEPHLRWRSFCDCVVSLAKTLSVKRAVLLGSYLADVVYSQPVRVSGFASDGVATETLGLETPRYEGPTGILGVLGDRLEREGLQVVSLWAGLPHYISASPNPRGALALLQKLTQCLDFRIDDEPLRQIAADFEQRISKIVASDPELVDYVKQLKRREFAQ